MSFLGISSTPTMAFALCQLDPSYNGPLVQVLRTSDNTYANVGIVAGKLDTTTLLSFCANTNGYVSTWYNQNGSNNHAVQTNQAYMPQIVSNGEMAVNMFGIAAPGMLIYNDFLTIPTAWANTPFSVILACNNYSSDNDYMSMVSNPFTTGTNSISLGTFNGRFDLQNVTQSDAQSPVLFYDNEDNLVTWTSSTGWISGSTVITNPSVFFPTAITQNYPYPTSSTTSLQYPSDTISNQSYIGSSGATIQSRYHFGAFVAFPSDLSSSDLYTATLNIANAIGIAITGPAYEASTILEVVETNYSFVQLTSATAETLTGIDSNSKVTSITVEVLCAVTDSNAVVISNTVISNTMLIATARPSFDLIAPNQVGDFDAEPLESLVYDVGVANEQVLIGNTEINLYVFRRDAFDYTDYSSPGGSLAQDLFFTDNTIIIATSTGSGMPFTLPVVEEVLTGESNSPTVVQTMSLPGIVWLNNERIEFFEYSVSGGLVTLSQIRRGTHNTRIGVEQRTVVSKAGDGSTTAFELPGVNSIANVVVTVNGPVTDQNGNILTSDGYTGFNINSSKHLNTDYSAVVGSNGVTITFTTAPASGTTVFLANNEETKHPIGSLVYDGLYSFLPIIKTSV